MLFEIAERREELRAAAAIECLSVVQAEVGPETVARVKRLFATGLSAFEGFYLNKFF